jgi:arginine exporter protein ArgO
LVLLSLLLSFSLIKFSNYQGLNTTVRGVFLIILSIVTLFTFKSNYPYYKVAIFWIGVGVLLYYGGIFFINGAYSSLIKKYPTDLAYFKKLHSIFNIIFNYLLYLFISIGLLCPRATLKYGLLSS